jgi:hypothetical protein
LLNILSHSTPRAVGTPAPTPTPYDEEPTIDQPWPGALPENGFDLGLAEPVEQAATPRGQFVRQGSALHPNTDDDETLDSVHPGILEIPDLELPEALEDTDSASDRRKSLHERLRGLPAAEQQKIAKTGELSERVALERIYGKQVWESLLRNPKLTPPEVARLARMGTLPKPLLESIVSNRSWIASPQVRRALLTNRRLGRDQVLAVLRSTPRAELKLMPKQTAYPATVRDAARTLLR